MATRNRNRMKAVIWGETSRVEVDGEIAWAVEMAFYMVKGARERIVLLKKLQAAHTTLSEAEVARNKLKGN